MLRQLLLAVVHYHFIPVVGNGCRLGVVWNLLVQPSNDNLVLINFNVNLSPNIEDGLCETLTVEVDLRL